MRTLVFLDRRSAGSYPVLSSSGAVLAHIRTSRGGTRFVAEDSTGALLCAGAVGWWGMSNVWRATGPDGEPLLVLRKDLFRSRAAVRLERDGELVVEGSWWRRTFRVRQGDEVVLRAAPRSPALSLRPYEFAVEQESDVLELAEVVAIVQTWRQLRRRDDATSATSAASATSIASA